MITKSELIVESTAMAKHQCKRSKNRSLWQKKKWYIIPYRQQPKTVELSEQVVTTTNY